jgi:alpha-ketoglutarate-dependent 2,4-dichlorophenoxyacetate dioxygenase
MSITFTKLHPTFVAEVSGIDLRNALDAATLERIRAGMDEYAVLVFRGQPFTDAEQLAFAQRLDGELHSKTGISALQKNRFGNEALTDISNVTEDGAIMERADRRRAYGLGNRLWHTDASFQDPPGRYSMLHARVIPPVAADTEYADMRAAYDALPDDMKTRLDGLRAHHSIAYSRQTLGLEFSEDEQDRMKGAVQPVVRTLPRTGRKSLYLASHANRILGWPVPDGRLLLRDLTEHATQRQFVYRHAWRVGDLVIWDNRCTMHRATPFDDGAYKRELRRVTTLDIERTSSPSPGQKELERGRV